MSIFGGFMVLAGAQLHSSIGPEVNIARGLMVVGFVVGVAACLVPPDL